MWEKKEILILVKAYPERSIKYGSAICMAGLTEDQEWIRIYPIDYNYFIKKLKFKKFTWIEAEVQKAREKLMRKESYKVKRETIKKVSDSLADVIGNKEEKEKIWEERKKLVIPMLSNSIAELRESWKVDKTSLGLIKPKLSDFLFRKPIEEIKIEHEKTLQQTLNGDKIFVPDKIEHKISYKFNCDDPKCNGHDMTCEGWELFESVRRWNYPPREKEEKIKYKYYTYMKEKRELYFYMGMISKFPQWVIIGLFYPPKKQ